MCHLPSGFTAWDGTIFLTQRKLDECEPAGLQVGRLGYLQPREGRLTFTRTQRI